MTTEPPTVVDIAVASRQLSKLVDRARAGEQILIAREGIALVSIVPVEDVVTRR